MKFCFRYIYIFYFHKHWIMFSPSFESWYHCFAACPIVTLSLSNRCRATRISHRNKKIAMKSVLYPTSQYSCKAHNVPSKFKIQAWVMALPWSIVCYDALRSCRRIGRVYRTWSQKKTSIAFSFTLFILFICFFLVLQFPTRQRTHDFPYQSSVYFSATPQMIFDSDFTFCYIS